MVFGGVAIAAGKGADCGLLIRGVARQEPEAYLKDICFLKIFGSAGTADGMAPAATAGAVCLGTGEVLTLCSQPSGMEKSTSCP